MKTAIVGPVFPFRAGVAYCTTRLAQELGADVISFTRQFPKRFYPGGDDVDPTLPRADARFMLDILNPLTWIRAGLALRAYDRVILVWWVWVWALPYLVLLALMRRRTRVVLQCHNIGDKEPAAWKRMLSNLVLRRGDVLVVHAKTEAEDAARRTSKPVVTTFLPVHELGGAIPSRDEARRQLGIDAKNVALFFGHVRPFKGLDIALRAWQQIETDALLLVAGEAWWKSEDEYRKLATKNVRLEFRFIPDAEIATYFAACDVVLAPYRIEAQSGVALTAFHFARPVIAADVGGLPEIVDADMLFPREDHAALAKRVDAFFARSDREELERRAASSARKYSWKEYGALLGRLVARE